VLARQESDSIDVTHGLTLDKIVEDI